MSHTTEHSAAACRSSRHTRVQHLITADESSLAELQVVLATLPICSTGRVFVEIPDASWQAEITVPSRMVLTWLDRSDRRTLKVHPRDDRSVPLRGVFSTRSQDRPNPIGIHRVRIVERESPLRFKVLDLEAIDGTPIVDVKPVLDRFQER